MKRIFSITLVAVMALQCAVCFAQRPHREGPGQCREPEKRPEITELVSNLSSSQKSKLEVITNESKKRIEELRKEQKALCEKISQLMDQEGDHSKEINPLFDREARLQAEISREMYTTKVLIDQILTKEQRKELLDSRKKHKMEQRKELRDNKTKHKMQKK